MSKKRRKAEDFGNRVSASERLLGALVACVSIFLAWDIVLSNKLTIIKHRHGGWLWRVFGDDRKPEIVILDGWPVFWAYLMLILVAVMALTFVIDHYDRRFNARFYRYLRRIMLIVTCGVAFAGGIAAMMQISGQ